MTSAVAQNIHALETEGALKGTDIASLVSVSKATVSRWRNGSATPQPDKELRLSDLLYVTRRLSEYYTPEEARIWLLSPHPQLNGERAISLIHEDRTEEVLEIIARLDAEVFI